MSFFGGRRQADTETEPVPHHPELVQQQQPPAAMPQPPVVGFETVIGANCTIEGSLHSSANIRIDGTFTGTLEINGNVLVGETAKITADINAKNISIAGAVRGNIYGKKVQLLRTSRVWGDINAAALTMEEGGFIDGKITMVQPTNEAEDEPAEAAIDPVDDQSGAVAEAADSDEPVAREEPIYEPADDESVAFSFGDSLDDDEPGEDESRPDDSGGY